MGHAGRNDAGRRAPARAAGDAQRSCSTGRCHSSSSVLQVTAMMGTRGVPPAPPTLVNRTVPSVAGAGMPEMPCDASEGFPARSKHDEGS